MPKPNYLSPPWTVVPGEEYGQYFLDEQREDDISETIYLEGSRPDELAVYDEANALLMSKAPEMYEALVALLGLSGKTRAPAWKNAQRLVDEIQKRGAVDG